ncbi:MAG: hypothetical protein HKN15_08600 [Xanthomonadales bacterium]|nr:hypothetical protein [Xanthomonadales bacterium]
MQERHIFGWKIESLKPFQGVGAGLWRQIENIVSKGAWRQILNFSGLADTKSSRIGIARLGDSLS